MSEENLFLKAITGGQRRRKTLIFQKIMDDCVKNGEKPCFRFDISSWLVNLIKTKKLPPPFLLKYISGV